MFENRDQIERKKRNTEEILFKRETKTARKGKKSILLQLEEKRRRMRYIFIAPETRRLFNESISINGKNFSFFTTQCSGNKLN